MSNPDKTSFVIITGTVISSVKNVNHTDKLVQFTLRNTDSIVMVRAVRHLVPHLHKNDHVSVVGHLASQHSRCGAQLFLQATIILTTSYPRLWDDIGVPALLRAIYALERAK